MRRSYLRTLLGLYVPIMLRQNLRVPSFFAAMIVFPPMFFGFFGVPNAESVEAANMLLASFSAFGVIGVSFFVFGVAYAQERHSRWSHFQQSLYILPGIPTLARICIALLCSVLAVLAVVIVALIATPISMLWTQWIEFSLAVLAASVPFHLMALILGNLANEKNATALANLVYLPLCFAGGLWMPPEILPKPIQAVSHYLPSRHYGEILWDISVKNAPTFTPWWGLLAWTLALSATWIFLSRKSPHL